MVEPPTRRASTQQRLCRVSPATYCQATPFQIRTDGVNVAAPPHVWCTGPLVIGYMRSARFSRCGMIFAGLLGGCGTAEIAAPTPCPTPAVAASVPILLSSTANDRLSQFSMAITSVTLTDWCGTRVNLFDDSTGKQIEFGHLNGLAEPLAIVRIPQGVYAAASLKVSYCNFTDVTYDSSNANVVISTYAQGLCGNGTGTTTVHFAAPLTIGRAAMALSFDLQVSRSYTLTGTGEFARYTITPVFNIAPIILSSDGEEDEIDGRITSLDSSGVISGLWIPDGVRLTMRANSGTALQGIGALADLAAGMFVEVNAALQADGSWLARRINVEDKAARNVIVGPVTRVFHSTNVFGIFGRQQQGDDVSLPSRSLGLGGYLQLTGSTVFQIAGGFGDLASLPFAAKFDTASLVAGQNTYVSISTPMSYCCGSNYNPVNSITLMPQTVDGTVLSVSTSGNFRIVRVALAPYDFISQLSGAASVFAYIDGSTQLLNSTPLGAGSVLRFRGLLFNDNSTLRMVCRQIRDGVAE